MIAVFGHRGASGSAPENTMYAFELAVAMGADGIELDCQMTKDGELVVFHDATLERVAGDSRFLKDATWAELAAVDVGSWFHSRFADARVPRLVDVLDWAKGRCIINVEIKNLPYRFFGIEKALLEAVQKTRFPEEDLIVSSFDHRSVQKVAGLRPGITAAALVAHFPLRFENLPGTVVHPHHSVVTDDFVIWAEAAGKRAVNVWTVNEPRQWAYLQRLGVNGIITDHPDALVAWLSSRQNPAPAGDEHHPRAGGA